MKAKILDINGKEKASIELPGCFSQPIREDVVAKVLESKKTQQPYAPSPVGGKQHSASGKIQHTRHVWKTMQGKGISRVPRKIMSRRGSQFNWVGAEIPSAVGGRRAHPPKIMGMAPGKINKKEMKIALTSALSASADNKIVLRKYESVKEVEGLPIVVENKITSLKTKELLSGLKKILGNLYDIAIKKKSIRAGKGKLRGRKYKKNAGMLFVIGQKEKLKTNAFDVKNAKKVSVMDLAKGGVGRLIVYTEEAIKELGERLKQ